MIFYAIFSLYRLNSPSLVKLNIYEVERMDNIQNFIAFFILKLNNILMYLY